MERVGGRGCWFLCSPNLSASACHPDVCGPKRWRRKNHFLLPSSRLYVRWVFTACQAPFQALRIHHPSSQVAEPGFECSSLMPNPHASHYGLPLARPVGNRAGHGCPPPARGTPRLRSHPVAPWAGLILTCLSSSKDRPESLGQVPERHGLWWASGGPWQAQGSGFLGPRVGSWEWWGLEVPTCSLVKSLC